jgi:selenocysteine lyase/cysteine desulfurase
MLDLEKIRRDTPGCQNVIHFNNAGSSLMPQPVLDSIIQHLQLESQIGGYEAKVAAYQRVKAVYNSIAALTGAEPDEIAIVENATRAWDMAFYSIPFQRGDQILTAMAEYASNYIAYLQMAKRTGVEIKVIPDDEHGQLSVDALRKAINNRVRLIAVTHVPTNGGLVNPAAEIGKVAREAGVLYLLDACQSIGQIPIDVKEIGCDMLSATGRKYLRGPRGTGFLFVRKQILDQLEPPFLDLHAATWIEPNRYEMLPNARRFENWETNIATKIGLGVAADYALHLGLTEIHQRVTSLADMLRSRLNKLRGVRVQDTGIEKCGIVSFTIQGKDPKQVREALFPQKVNVWYSYSSSTLLDMQARNLKGVVRASVHYFNTEVEIDRFIRILELML